MKVKLTEKRVAKLRAPTATGKQEVVKGFGVLCSGVTSAKTYIVQRDLKNKKTRRVTIAPVNMLSLKDARAKAEKVIANFIDREGPEGARHGSYISQRGYVQPRASHHREVAAIVYSAGN